MATSPRDNFFLRDGFESFRVDPDANPELLLGERDRALRDQLLDAIEENRSMGEGYKAVIYGDYGRGKTQQSRNLIYHCGPKGRSLAVQPIYIKCIEYGPKEPFASFFSEFLDGIGAQRLGALAVEYKRLVNDGGAPDFSELTDDHDIHTPFDALVSPNSSVVRLAVRWLGGQKLKASEVPQIGDALGEPPHTSRDFSTVLAIIARMFRVIRGAVPLFFVDEAERIGRVTHIDTYIGWQAALRAISELPDIGIVFFVGGKTFEDIPDLLTWDEVRTRIGAANYRDILNPGPDDRRQWLEEVFEVLCQKGKLSPPLSSLVSRHAADQDLPAGLQALVGSDPDALRSYPFTPEALDAFIAETDTDQGNKPRYMLKRLQHAAGRALTLGKNIIDRDVLDATRGEGF